MIVLTDWYVEFILAVRELTGVIQSAQTLAGIGRHSAENGDENKSGSSNHYLWNYPGRYTGTHKARSALAACIY
jgi:hypothetical protein